MSRHKFCWFFGIFLIGFWMITLKTETAAAATSQVYDDASLFDQAQLTALNNTIENDEKKIDGKIFVVTTNDAQGKTAQDYADTFNLKLGYGKNDNKHSILFLIDMDNRELQLSTTGDMRYYFSDKRIDSILDDITTYAKSGDYYSAADTFIGDVKKIYSEGLPKDAYLRDEATGKITRIRQLKPFEIAIALVMASLVSALFLVLVVGRYQLKLGTYKYPFREKGSLKLSEREDTLTNSFVTTRRIPRPQNTGGGGGGSSTHSSSGGGSFGGGGRGF